MADDGDEPVTLTTLGTIAAIASVGTGLATTGLALSKGGPDLPKVEAPPPPPLPPAPPPEPATAAPPPSETLVGEAVGKEKRKRATRFGIEQTLLSPLGGAGSATRTGQSLLGG